MYCFNIPEFVVPICLPYEDDAKEDYRNHKHKTNNEVFVAGWGVTGNKGNYYIPNNNSIVCVLCMFAIYRLRDYLTNPSNS